MTQIKGPTQAQIDHPLAIISMLLIGVAGAYSTVVLPFIIGQISDALSLSAARSGTVASVEMIGIAVGAFLISLMVVKQNRRTLVFASATIAVLANGAATMIADFQILLGARFFAGLGAGGLLAGFAAAVGGTSKPDRIFAIFVASAFIAATLSFKVLPRWQLTQSLDGLFWFLAAVNIIALWACMFFPSHAPQALENANLAEANTALSIGVWPPVFGLAGILSYYMGIGGVWPLMPEIGQWVSVAADEITDILANASLGAMAGALFAAALGTRLGRSGPLSVGLCGVAFCMAAISTIQAPWAFSILVPLFLGCWNFSVPYLMGTLAVLDPSGRAVAFNMTLQYVGFGFGPIAAASVLSAGGFSAVLWFCAITSLASLIIYLFALNMAERRNKNAKVPA